MVVEAQPDGRRGWIIVTVTGVLNIEELLHLIQTARDGVERRMIPMLVDARNASGALSDAEVERAVGAVQHAVHAGGMRGHVAIVSDHDGVYPSMLRYEARCADIGVGVIRAFRELPDAERWLEIISAARDLR